MIKKITLSFLLLASLVVLSGKVLADTLISIEISNPADRTEYVVGEGLDITGLEVTGHFLGEDGYDAPVAITEANISGFDSSAPAVDQVLTITVGDQTTTYTVVVVAATVIEEVAPRRSSSGGRSSSAPAVLGATADIEGQVLGATTDTATSTFKFNVDLRVGSQGADVVALQERLRAEGFFIYPTSTGYFGPITLAAVKAYQTAKGIPFITGFVGPLTRAELNK